MPDTPRSCDAVAFDLDGTLVDTAALHVAATAAATLVVFGVAAPPDAIRRSLGRPLPESMRVVSDGRGQIDELARAFLRYYAAREGDGAQCFAGTLATLDALRHAGLRLALLSNKLRVWGLDEIARLGLAPYFECVVFMEDMPRPKPSGWALRPVLETLRLPPERVLVVGDSVADIACARAAGAPSGAALWGAPDPAPLIAATPTYLFDALADLTRLAGASA